MTDVLIDEKQLKLWVHGNYFSVGVEVVLQLPNSPPETLRTTCVNSSLMKCTFSHQIQKLLLEKRKGVGISLKQRGEDVKKSHYTLLHDQHDSGDQHHSSDAFKDSTLPAELADDAGTAMVPARKPRFLPFLLDRP